MLIKLSEKIIREAKPEGKPAEYNDTIMKGLILRVQPTGTKTFLFAYRHTDGKRKRKTLGRYGAITLHQARELYKLTAADVVQGKDPQQELKQKRDDAKKERGYKLGIFIDEVYGPIVLNRNKRGDYNLEVLNRDFKFLLDKSLYDITPTEIERWKIKMTKRGLKANTVNRRLACLKAVFSVAVDINIIDISPIRKVKNLKQLDDGRIRFLSEDENKRLRDAMRYRNGELISSRLRANNWRSNRGYEPYVEYQECQFADHIEPMVLLALNTGMRRGEIFHLTWQDINLKTGMINVRAINSKSNKGRHIPLNKEVETVINIWLEQQPKKKWYVFPNKSGNRFTDIKKGWGSVLSQAGIDNFRFHDLRHDFASQLVMKGVPLNTVRDLLGHADIATTLRYAHLAKDHKLDAVLLLDD